MQNLLKKENLLFRNKDERNIQCNAYVNNNKSNFPFDGILIPFSKTFKDTFFCVGKNFLLS